MNEQRLRIGITQGDTNGIGWEVIIKCFADGKLCETFTPVIYGSPKVAAYYKKGIAEAENLSFNVVESARDARPRKVNIVDTSKGEDIKVEPGQPSPEAGMAAFAALEAAVTDLTEHQIDALVTAPINKETIQSDAFRFKGHTEYLADRCGGEPLMMMCSDILKVGLATVHEPVAEIAGKITKEGIVAKLRQIRSSLIADFSVVEPRIAVLALNPHAGDGGLLGTEEQEIIRPAVQEAAAGKVLAFGPFPADGFFASGAFARYDAVLAMYHDQGLAPFKALTPEGVNFTASLGVVRTSPDHGVAYDIAGKDQADPQSMRNAIYMAIDIIRSRRTYREITANPLKHYEREKGADMSVKDLKLPEQED